MSHVPPPIEFQTFQTRTGWGWVAKRCDVILGSGDSYDSEAAVMAAIDEFMPTAKKLAREATDKEEKEFEAVAADGLVSIFELAADGSIKVKQ